MDSELQHIPFQFQRPVHPSEELRVLLRVVSKTRFVMVGAHPSLAEGQLDPVPQGIDQGDFLHYWAYASEKRVRRTPLDRSASLIRGEVNAASSWDHSKFQGYRAQRPGVVTPGCATNSKTPAPR